MTGLCWPNLSQMCKFDAMVMLSLSMISCLSPYRSGYGWAMGHWNECRLWRNHRNTKAAKTKSESTQSCFFLKASLGSNPRLACTASLQGSDCTTWIAGSRNSSRLLQLNYYFFFCPPIFPACHLYSPSLLNSCKWVSYFFISLLKYSFPFDLHSLSLPALWRGKLAASPNRDLVAVTSQGMCILSRGAVTTGFRWSVLLPWVLLLHIRDEHNHADLTKSISVFLWKGLWVFCKDSCWVLVWFCLLLLEITISWSVCASLSSVVVKFPGEPYSLQSLGVQLLLLG